MLFNSYAFIFIFLPIALIGYHLAGYFHRKAVVAWLGFVSLGFYAYWRPAFVLILLASIALNYLAAGLISGRIRSGTSSRGWMWMAILFNLGALAYFKYLFPFLNFWSGALGSHAHWTDAVLPLGISFFTFTQIAYFVDLQQGTATLQDPLSYVLFVTFFPHLIAGPILHHQEMMPQFQQIQRYRLRIDDIAVGFSWFLMGLGKKVILADHLATPVNTIFSFHEPLPALLAWRGVLGYALQLYFDFSGYSDMALGLARMFSIDFPLNFSSPYKAANIIDFWQRWHITLTRYITAYVYSPLQLRVSARRQEKGKKVSRKALSTPEGFVSMIASPMIFTMFIAGIWHGAGLQFIVFGLLHGCYLTVNHGWRLFRHNRAGQTIPETGLIARAVRHGGSVLLTFLCVIVAQVFFRANSCSHAFSILAGMAGLHGLGLHARLEGESVAAGARRLAIIGACLAAVWTLPNTQQILGLFKPALERTVWDTDIADRRLLWFPNLRWAAALGCVFLAALVSLQDSSTFLYFQF